MRWGGLLRLGVLLGMGLAGVSAVMAAPLAEDGESSALTSTVEIGTVEQTMAVLQETTAENASTVGKTTELPTTAETDTAAGEGAPEQSEGNITSEDTAVSPAGDGLASREDDVLTDEEYLEAVAAMDQALEEAYTLLHGANETAPHDDAATSIAAQARALHREFAPNNGILDGFSLTTVRSGSAPRGTATFTASDSADNYEDNFNLGDNGGTGFKGWEQLGDSAPSREISAADGFVIGYDGGLGRQLEQPLISGTFTVDAKHGFDDLFSGFALYTANGAEVVRWGLTTANDRESGRDDVVGLWYALATGGQNEYIFWTENRNLVGVALQYSITWSQRTGGGLLLNLAAFDAEGSLVGSAINVEALSESTMAIYAVGSLVAGNSENDHLSFDHLYVEGEPLPNVPEPATMALLAVGTVCCILRRRARRR